jgi:hypothetical protein
MAVTNTKSTMNALFKIKVAPKVDKLVPDFSILQKIMGPLEPAEKQGRFYRQPVMISGENGRTAGDGTAFTYNASVAGVYLDADVESFPTVVTSRISLAAANAMVEGTSSSFVSTMTFKASMMKESLAKTMELCALGYGKTGLGTISGNPAVPGNATVILTDASWSPAIWAGLEGSLLEARVAGVLVNTNADLVLVSVDVDNKTIVVSGNNADLLALADGDVIYFKGFYSNTFYGLKSILVNTGSLFGISAASYNLWKATTFPVGGNLTMSKLLKAAAKGVGKGGLTGTAICLLSSLTFEGLNSDLAALRMFDSSYSPKKGENGVESIEYRYQGGKLKIIAHPFVQEGEAMLGPENGIKKIGSTDITFEAFGQDYFTELSDVAAIQWACQADWCVFLEKPAQWVYLSGITNS